MFTTRLAAVLALVSATGCVIDGGADATIEVANGSDYVIDELYLTDVDSSSWGANLLGVDGLFPNESIVLGVECGLYDALLVDEDGVHCEVNALDLCFNDALWMITNNTCSVFGAKLTPAGSNAATPADATAK